MPGAGCRAAANEIKDTAITPEKICTVSQERSCTPQELPDAYEKEVGGPPLASVPPFHISRLFLCINMNKRQIIRIICLFLYIAIQKRQLIRCFFTCFLQ